MKYDQSCYLASWQSKGTSYAWYNGNWWPRNKIRLRPSWRQYVTNYSGDTLFLMDVTWQFTWFFMKSDSEPKWTSVSPWGTSNMKIDKGFCLDKISLSFLSIYLSFSLSVCPSVRVCLCLCLSLFSSIFVSIIGPKDSHTYMGHYKSITCLCLFYFSNNEQVV